MIDFRFTIKNPFHSEDKSPWRPIFQKEKLISKYKVLEIGFFKYAYFLFELSMSTAFSGGDHAGPKFVLSVLGYEFCIGIYDSRHWDYELNKWSTP